MNFKTLTASILLGSFLTLGLLTGCSKPADNADMPPASEETEAAPATEGDAAAPATDAAAPATDAAAPAEEGAAAPAEEHKEEAAH